MGLIDYIKTYKRFFILLILASFILSLPITISLLNQQQKQESTEPISTITSDACANFGGTCFYGRTTCPMPGTEVALDPDSGCASTSICCKVRAGGSACTNAGGTCSSGNSCPGSGNEVALAPEDKCATGSICCKVGTGESPCANVGGTCLQGSSCPISGTQVALAPGDQCASGSVCCKVQGGGACPVNGNRLDCDAIRGTQYCSDEERAWYLDPANGCIKDPGQGGNPPGGNPPPPESQPLDCISTPGRICPGVNLYGNDIDSYNNTGTQFPATADDCQIGCQEDARCAAWTFQHDTKTCWLKNPVPSANEDSNTTSGIKVAPPNRCPDPAYPYFCGDQCWNLTSALCGGRERTCVNGNPGCAPPPITPSGLTHSSLTCSSVTLNWSGSGQGWWADISTTFDFANFSNKSVDNTTSTTAPSGFNPAFTLTPGKTYHWRLYYGVPDKWTNYASFTVPQCAPPPVTQPPVTKPPVTKPPTVKVTLPPTITTTVSPSVSPSPSTTITPNELRITLDVRLAGIGANTAAGQNSNPVRTGQPIQLQIFNASGQKIKDASGNLTFDSTSKTFKGTISLGADLQNGAYTIKGRFNNTLWKAQSAQLTSGQTSTLPAVQYITGDLDQNNELNLLDYNTLLSCFGTKQCGKKEQADLNIDGIVDEKDLNILLANFAKRAGD